MNVKTIRSAIHSAAAFAIAAGAITACGELTGPESPSTPSNVVATLASATSVNVTWTPSPLNDGVVSYTIYRNGNEVGTSETTSFTDTGLAQQTTYVYSVAANCKGGVISDRSLETPQSTVVTIDITPPRVLSTSPANGLTAVSRAATVTATFSEPMDPATITASTFNVRVTSSGQILAGTLTYNTTTRVAEIVPTGGLPNATNLTTTITKGVKDLAGNAMLKDTTVQWTTRDEEGPAVVSSVPANGATGVSATAAITVTFSEAVTAASVNTTNLSLKVTSSGANVPGAIVFNGTNIATFTPSAPLSQGVNYTFTVNGVRDLQNNAMPAPFSITFTVGDNTAQTVISTSPADLASGVPTNTTISATFSEAMDQLSLTTATFIVRPTAGGANVPGTVAYTAGTNTATFTPASPLAGGTPYTVTITTGAKDAAGNPLAAPKTWTFATLDTTPPTVSSVLPANNATNVATNATVQITFSEAMDVTTITPTNIVLRNAGTSAIVPATVAYNSTTNVATLTPTGPLSNTTNYTVTVTTAVKDAAGNQLASQFTSQFTTAGLADTTAPTITARTPAPGATNVATATTVTVTFNEPMDATTIVYTNANNGNITLKPTGGGPNITATVTCNSPCTTATLDPAVALANNTGYTVTVTTGVKDVAGNGLAAQSTWTFTTAADVTAPTVLSTAPTDLAINVSKTTTIKVVFSEDMDPTTLNGTLTNFTVKTTTGSVPVAGVVSYNNADRTATFTVTGTLAGNTNYEVTVSGARDANGVLMVGSFTFHFTTAP